MSPPVSLHSFKNTLFSVGHVPGRHTVLGIFLVDMLLQWDLEKPSRFCLVCPGLWEAFGKVEQKLS